MRDLAPVPAGEIRALTLLDAVPAGCRAMAVLDDKNAPHLRLGEVAVIDPADCGLVHGELYAVQFGRGPSITQALWRRHDDQGHWWTHTLNRPCDWPETDAWMRAGKTVPAADGPYRSGGLEEKILGRVIGLLQPSTFMVPYVE